MADSAAAQDHIGDLIQGWRRHADLSRRRFMEVERDEALELLGEINRLREEIRLREESQIPVIPHGAAVQLERLQVEVERLRDRAVCSGCGGDVAESGACIAKCGEGEMIPASELPLALRAMREQRDEWRQEAMSL